VDVDKEDEMPTQGNDPKAAEEKEKTPKTKPMPHSQLKDFTEWVEKLPKAKPGDKGKAPPDPPQDLKEPREHGTVEQQ
jgi:hypothetical protein